MSRGIAERRRSISVLLWSIVFTLAFLGFATSVARAFGVFESLWWSGDARLELSSLDRGSMILMAALLEIDPGSPIYLDVAEQNRRFLGKFNRHPAVTLVHVIPAALFVVLAPIQFSRTMRSRHRGWHRWSGRLILLLAVPVGISGLLFGLLMPFSGLLESSAIALFGTLFFWSAVRGFLSARRRDFNAHREWMIRMCGVAFGVSTVRLVGIALALVTREGPETWFGASVWIGFVITTAAAELRIRGTRGSAGDEAGILPHAVVQPEGR
ncbi:MAG TPA: DUF2306 domain-containing protein [Thermoanaerobaculia bacterium]|nr:DUF2306 domain-containing protein [Thermoanaerobaculia bacterium]